MSNRTFILALCALVLSCGGLMLWLLDDGEQASKPKAPESVENEGRKPSAHAKRATSRNRFEKLTDNSIRWQVKVDKLRKLDGKTVTKSEIDYLFELLKSQPELGDKEAWWVVVNEIMEQMRKQGLAKDRYTNELIGIINNPSLNTVTRDYAIQHLAIWLAPRSGNIDSPHEENINNISKGADTLSKVITDPALQDSSLPGTALMALVDLHQVATIPEKIETVFTELEPWLKNVLAGNSQMSLITRTSAINAVGLMQRKEHLPIIREIVSSITSPQTSLESTPDSVKLSSIAAFGHLAEESDFPTLEEIAKGNTKFKHAAQSALKRISNR